MLVNMRAMWKAKGCREILNQSVRALNEANKIMREAGKTQILLQK